jgi:hypothetical protein
MNITALLLKTTRANAGTFQPGGEFDECNPARPNALEHIEYSFNVIARGILPAPVATGMAIGKLSAYCNLGVISTSEFTRYMDRIEKIVTSNLSTARRDREH